VKLEQWLVCDRGTELERNGDGDVNLRFCSPADGGRAQGTLPSPRARGGVRLILVSNKECWTGEGDLILFGVAPAVAVKTHSDFWPLLAPL